MLPTLAKRLFSLVVAAPLAWALSATAPAQGLAPLQCPDAKELCLQAERAAEIDLKKGTAELEGNVRGYLKTDDLNFRAGLVKAFRNDQNEWVRLVLEKEVRLTRPNQQANADHAVLERETMRLVGNVRVESDQELVTAEDLLVENKGQRTTILGKAGELFLIRFAGDLLANQQKAAPPGAREPKTVEAQANRGVIDRAQNLIELSGHVSVVQADPGLNLSANLVRLEFEGPRTVKGFRAEGGVKINQPGRELASDLAYSMNNNQTILLIGNAKVSQAGEFQLASDRIEVYSDAKKGVVQSQDQGQPITLSLDSGRDTSYLFDLKQFRALNGQGIPRDTLNKLSPLLGRTFDTPLAFRKAVRGVLTPRETGAYLEIIAAPAK